MMSKKEEMIMRKGYEAERKERKRKRTEDLIECYLTAFAILFFTWMVISFIDVNIHNMNGNQTYQFLPWNLFGLLNHPNINAWMYAGYGI